MTPDQSIEELKTLMTTGKIPFVLGSDIIIAINLLQQQNNELTKDADLRKKDIEYYIAQNTKNYNEARYYSNCLVDLGYLRYAS